ncbi:helix-turn-helix transcriptional regulator [Lysobacter sp. P5_B9]
MILPPEQAASLLTEKDVAARLRLSPAMLQKLRRDGGGPAFVRIGSAVRYPDTAVLAWLAALSAQR